MRTLALGFLMMWALPLALVAGCSRPATTEEAPLDRTGQPIKSMSEDELKAQAERVKAELKGGGRSAGSE